MPDSGTGTGTAEDATVDTSTPVADVNTEDELHKEIESADKKIKLLKTHLEGAEKEAAKLRARLHLHKGGN